MTQGFFFNPDSRFMAVLSEFANKRDLKSLRYIFVHFLELPEFKASFIEKYGQQAYDELMTKYNLTNKSEPDQKKQKKITQLKTLGFTQEQAEAIVEMTSRLY